MWDKEDRETDNRRLERGEGLFELGHQTPASTIQDADFDETLSMPPHSPWPLMAAVMLAGVFAMLLLRHYTIALGFVFAGTLTTFAWHRKEVSG